MKLGVSLAGYPWAASRDGWNEHASWVGQHCDVVGFPMPYWSQLEPIRGQWNPAAFRDLDVIVDEARAMGLKVFLFMTYWPPWATAAHRARRGGRLRVSPDDLSVNGPWGTYCYRVLMRYAKRVEWVAPLNEPNFAFWDDPTTMAADTATMMRTAATVASRVPNSPMLLMPAVLDADIGGQSNWHTFMESVLGHLQGWRPPRNVRIGWAHHPYTDVHEGNATRTQHALYLLEKYGWHDGRKIYLTEGGFQLDAHPVAPGSNTYVYSDPRQIQTQTEHLARFYAWTAGLVEPKIDGEAVLGMHWLMQDTGWGHWQSGLISPDGTQHPIVPLWENVRHK